MSWRDRLEREPSLRNLAEWPAIDYTLIPTNRRSQFLMNRRVISRVLTGQTLQAVAKLEGLSKGRVSQLLERCLGGNLEEPALLSEALIPHVQVISPKRSLPLPSHESPSGCTGAFRELLAQVPKVKQELDQAIEADFKRESVSERLTASSLHSRFLFRLAALNWPTHQYPYTTASRGSESIRRYWNDYKQELAQKSHLRQSSSPAKTLSLSAGRALSEIQIDEHQMDVHSRVSIDLGGELIHLRLSRCTLLLAIDVATQCVLGCNLVPGTAPNQQDMLELIENCLNQRTAPTFTTPQFGKPEGPTFPSEVVPALKLSLGTVLLDNAWIHHSNAVVDFLTDRMGSSVRFGFPARPKDRALVERVFNFVEKRLGHRFDSTAGSTPTDPAKESQKNAKKPPCVSFQTLEEAVYLTIADFNHRRQPHLGDCSAMALFRHQLETRWIRHFAHSGSGVYRPSVSKRTVPVHRPRPGDGTPYVNLEYCRYRGPGLAGLSWKQSHVVIEYDRRDIRKIKATTVMGEFVGDLRAPLSWQQFPHSVATRRLLFKHKRVHRGDHQDPISGYFSDLLAEREKPKVASQILKIHLEMKGGCQRTPEPAEEKLLLKNSARLLETEKAHENRSSTRQGYRWSPIHVPMQEE